MPFHRLIDDIYEASYGGIPFLALVTETVGGRKDVLHSFPNSDKQLIEDLGPKPRDYSLTAIINETIRTPYIRKRDQLLAVLEKGDLLDLVHPFYGLVGNVVVRNFTIREDLRSLGDSEIDINFAISNTTGLSVRASPGISASVLDSIKFEIALDVITAISNGFIVRGSDSGNINNALSILGKFVDIIKSGTVASPVNTSLLDGFVRKLTNFEDNIPVLMFSPTELGTQISTITKDYAGVYSDPPDKVGAMEDLFDFGIDDVSFALDTTARIQRQTNIDVINDSVNALALSESYVAASQITFSNINEINELENRLERQYRIIVT